MGNDLDVFLRWLWDEIFVSQVLNEAELNVYVGLAFETHAEGMNVYLYYGLDEDCSLKSVGAALGKGDGGIKVNLDHIFDEDGFQCETPQVIPLIHQHDIECANGYYFQIGDIPGNGIGGLRQVPDCNER